VEMQSKIVTAELRNWSRETVHGIALIVGDVYGDSKGRWKDGTYIRTSNLLGVTEGSDFFLFQTRNSVYKCYKSQRVASGTPRP
jgi:hypothetical protein